MAILTRRRSRTWLAFTLVVATVLWSDAAGPRIARAAPVASAQAVYAAFTVNLTRFISWPEAAFPGPNDPLVIGTFAKDPINGELDRAVQDERVGNRRLVTMRLQSLNDVARCHLVFVSRDVTDVGSVLARTRGRPILTISDAEGFVLLGGHVRFVPQPTGTRLQVSAENLRRDGLEARSQLLRIASAP